jgi:hypothetical protein
MVWRLPTELRPKDLTWKWNRLLLYQTTCHFSLHFEPHVPSTCFTEVFFNFAPDGFANS